MRAQRGNLIRLAVLAMAALLGCDAGERETNGESGTGARGQVNRYLTSLPPWSEFSPPLSPSPARPAGVAKASFQASLKGVTYVCRHIPHAVTENPETLVMFTPPPEVLWPGALIQGRSHRDGLGSLLSLPIAQRTPVKLSIPSLPAGGSLREVNPSRAEVASAIGDMLAQATRRGLPASSSVLFQMRPYRSEAEFALAGKLSGRYLGFVASASAEVSTSAAETTVAGLLAREMFEVAVEPPRTPGAFFRDDFDEERLDEQRGLGHLGPDNLPVYVSNAVYGRMLMFALTSTAPESDIRGALNAAYGNALAGGGVELSAKHREILETARLSVSSAGGDTANAEAMIRSGDWRGYFEGEAPLSSATPLSYTLRSLGDGKIAVVSETAHYDVTRCAAKTGDGFFGFLPVVDDENAPIPVPYSPRVGDFNGDGRDDVVWNHLGASRNALYLGLGQPGAMVELTQAWRHPENPSEGWANYELLVGDLDGDGKDDLIWNHLSASAPSGSSRNVIYTALSNADGSFRPAARQEHPARTPRYGWLDFGKVVADLDGDGDQDLAWTSGSGEALFYLGRSTGEGVFTVSVDPERPCSDLPVGRVVVSGDTNGDGRSELVWLLAEESEDGSTALNSLATVSRVDGHFDCVASHVPGDFTDQAGVPEVHSGDHNADGRSDLLLHSKGKGLRVEVRHGGAGWSYGNGCSAAWSGVPGLQGPFFGDFNGDAREDLVFEGGPDQTTEQLWVALAAPEPTCFQLHSPQAQAHPAFAPWESAERLIADLDGDGRGELIYNVTEATNRLLVAVGW